jgi:hypothetical protein
MQWREKYLLSSLIGGTPNADDGYLRDLAAIKVAGRPLVAVDVPQPETDVRCVVCLHHGLHHGLKEEIQVEPGILDLLK